MRKRRTRNHVIADMSVNHFERQALLCGYSVERVGADYGIDLYLFTYREDGQAEAESVRVQMKATDNLTFLQDGETIPLSILRSDLDFWLAQMLPVILVLYDAVTHTAYWLCVQSYFQQRPALGLALTGEKTTLYFSSANRLDAAALRGIARMKNDILERKTGEIRYEIPEIDDRTDGAPA